MLGGTREQVRLALQSCGYRLPERCVIAVGVGSEPQAEVVRPPRRRFPRDTSVRLVVEVGVGWYSQVFQRGLAVVQGNFVLAAVTPRGR